MKDASCRRSHASEVRRYTTTTTTTRQLLLPDDECAERDSPREQFPKDEISRIADGRACVYGALRGPAYAQHATRYFRPRDAKGGKEDRAEFLGEIRLD